MADGPTVTVSQEFLEGMQKKVERLKTLMEISSLIASTLDFDELISLVMEKAKNVMEAEACSILLYNRETGKLEFEVAICGEDDTSEILKKQVTLDMGQGIAGWVAQNLQPLVIDDVTSDSRFCSDADRRTGFRTRNIIAVPLIGRRGLIGVAEMVNPKKKDYDMEIFQLLCRQFAIAIENSLFHEESIERERIRQELDIASALQKSFLPESPVFKEGDLTVSAENISAEKVGGDIYDFVETGRGKVGVLIGDVSGKGVSAALYMAKFSSDFRYAAHLEDSPSLVLERLNLSLMKSPRGMFLTCIYMIVDVKTGEVTVSVAGHPPFLWITDRGVEIETVPSGPPLGIIPSEYPATSLSLGKGDRLLLLTDGVFDAKNGEGLRLGFENLFGFIMRHRNTRDIVRTVVDYVDDFSAGRERADDLTMVEIRWGDRD
jgi:sigma-B regulation protein RsbU (phosphoserine phosphatase)